MNRVVLVAAALLLAASMATAAEKKPAAKMTPVPAATSSVPPACTAGDTTCSNDAINARGISAFVTGSISGSHVTTLWTRFCQSIYSSPASETGHSYRVAFCQAIEQGRVPVTTLTKPVLTATTISQILEGQAACAALPDPSTCPNAELGNLVDSDAFSAIDTALTVHAAVVTTTASAPTGSAVITVADATGIGPGQTVAGLGIPLGTMVTTVSGTNVGINSMTQVALTSAGVQFYAYYGLVTSPRWQ